MERNFPSTGFYHLVKAVCFSVVVSSTTPVPANAKPEHTFRGKADEQLTLAERYCTNVGDAAADARVSWQAESLKKLTEELDKRLKALESKTVKLKEWVAKREEFVRRGNDALVRIYSGMRPDAASKQLVSLDEMTAAAILIKLDPRSASAILGEMDPVKAARLTSVIAGSARVGKKSGDT